jgi:peptidoglycan hydrolase CwlO-like protein
MKDYLIENIDNILAYIFGAGGIISGWFERKKRKADALSGMQENYDRFVEHAKQKWGEFEEEIKQLQEEIKRVKEHAKKEYDLLKAEFDKYKKTHP